MQKLGMITAVFLASLVAIYLIGYLASFIILMSIGTGFSDSAVISISWPLVILIAIFWRGK